MWINTFCQVMCKYADIDMKGENLESLHFCLFKWPTDTRTVTTALQINELVKN